MASNRVYEIVTDRIVQRIEEAIASGTELPWHKPWVASQTPRNYKTRIPYRGINIYLLEFGHSYLTWNQLCDLQKQNPEIRLKKGSKAQIVVFFSFKKGVKDVVGKDGQVEQKEVDIPFLRYYNVYDSLDVENLPPLEDEQTFEHTPIEAAEQILMDYIEREEGLTLEYNDGQAAYYSPTLDLISLPRRELFPTYARFFATAAHESVHSTGAKHRLNRIKQTAHFGDESYSREELIADMGQNFLFAELGIDSTDVADNSIAYMRGWLKALKDDVRMIVTAASAASKAVDYILGRKVTE
ncbi:MAG: DUF1738 domain-containing protein [Clostridia bacterium]|nr:DUF1738 domain-containing protein [Clostridia bacterium]